MADSESVSAAKRAIRDRTRERRCAVDARWIAQASAAIVRRVVAMDEFAGARVVCCYVATTGEAQTEGIIKACRTAGKKVCVPALDEEEGCYRLAWLMPGADLVSGPMGIREPREKRWAPVAEVDLMIVPGVAFDAEGGRVGHGFGHYDRLLADPQGTRCFTVGLAFDFQVWDGVPTEIRDVRMDAVVTETRCHLRKPGGRVGPSCVSSESE